MRPKIFLKIPGKNAQERTERDLPKNGQEKKGEERKNKEGFTMKRSKRIDEFFEVKRINR